MFVTTARTATATTPAGWTLQGVVTDSDVRSWVFTRSAAAGTPGSTVQVSFDAISKTDLTLLAYSGPVQPQRTVSRAEPGTTALHTSPAAACRHAPVRPSSPTGPTRCRAAHGWTLPAGVTHALGDGRDRLRPGHRDLG